MSIVDELRDRAYSGKATDSLCERAADEIERLRGDAEIARLRLAASHADAELFRKSLESQASDCQPDWRDHAQQEPVACPYVRGKTTQYCSLNFALTGAEREAIREAVGAYYNLDDDEECAKIAAELDGLLKRLG